MRTADAIWKDAKAMAEVIRDADLAGFLTCSYAPDRNDALDFGERVRNFLEGAVEALLDEEERERRAEQSEPDAANASECMDRDNAQYVNRMNRGL